MSSPREPDAREALAERIAARIDGILNYSGELRFDLSIAELQTIEAALRQAAAPGGEPKVKELLLAIQQRANETGGTGVMALIDTIHAMHKLAGDALAALPPATLPSDDRAKVVEECAKAADETASYLSDPSTIYIANIIAKKIRSLSPPTESELRQARENLLGSEGVEAWPWVIKTDPDLLALIERAKSHVMTPEESYAQRRSFVRGMCPSSRNYAEWCSLVDKMLPPLIANDAAAAADE